MSSPPPIPCFWTGEAFVPTRGFLAAARQHYGEGEVVALVPHENRSIASHNQFFALVHEAWTNLPEHQAERFPNEDALRKYALCKAGFCDVATHVAPSRAAAQEMAAFLRSQRMGDLVVHDGSTVTVLTAQSQSMRAMGKARFQESKDAVLGVLATMISVEPETLKRQTENA